MTRIRIRKANRFSGDDRYEVVGEGRTIVFSSKRRAQEVKRARQRIRRRRISHS